MPLVSSNSLRPLLTRPGCWAIPAHLIAGRRVGGYKYISIQQTPSTPTTTIDTKPSTSSIAASTPDATFEVLGTTHSLLSITLSPSQPLHTRRGTLTALSTTDPTSIISTLRTLSPIRRALQGIPFLYQRITSTTPISLVLAPKSPSSSLTILQLDGTQDWTLSQRAALLAWTGSNIRVRPTLPTSLSSTSWGNATITGRGLVGLVGAGHIFAIDLAKGETYIAHPQNILAYSITHAPSIPSPFRFRSSQPRFQIPLNLGNWFPDNRFARAFKTSSTYKFFQGVSLRVKTWSRRTIWGDRLFLRFEGPATILLQSRGNRVTDIMTSEQINEIADAPAGVVGKTIRNVRIQEEDPSFRQSSSLLGTQKQTQTQIQSAVGQSLSGKSDAARMGVQGARVDAQTDAGVLENAPKIVDAEGEGPEKSAGAKELERLGREKGSVADKVKVGGGTAAKTDHAA